MTHETESICTLVYESGCGSEAIYDADGTKIDERICGGYSAGDLGDVTRCARYRVRQVDESAMIGVDCFTDEYGQQECSEMTFPERIDDARIMHRD